MFLNLGLSWGAAGLMGAAHLSWLLVPYSHAIQTLSLWKKSQCTSREHQTCRKWEHMRLWPSLEPSVGSFLKPAAPGIRDCFQTLPSWSLVGQENRRVYFSGITLPHPQPSPEPELCSPGTSVPTIHPAPVWCAGGCRNKLQGHQDGGVYRGADGV